VAEAQTFNLEKAVTEAKTPAEHEAIASYYDKEAATAKDKAAEHHRLMEAYRTQSVVPRGQPTMANHCQQLAQNYERIAAENSALAAAHRQMAQEAAQKK
jgi:hypothetical protein